MDGRDAPPRYAHETGELEGVENGVGIFLLPGGPLGRTFALAVVVEGGCGTTRGGARGGARVGGAAGHLRVLHQSGRGVARGPCGGRMYEHSSVLHARDERVNCGYARAA